MTLEPERYSELIDTWSNSLDAMTQDSVEGVNRHFDRAVTIMDRLGRGEMAPLHDPVAMTTSSPQAALLLSSDGKILATSPAFVAFCGSEPALLDDLHLSGPSETELRDLLGKLEIQRVDHALMILRIYHQADDTALIMTVVAEDLPNGERVALISALDLAYREQVGELVGETFGLTKSEVVVAQSLVDGLSINEIAKMRARSLDTVRTQVKSVLQKADLRSQTELIRVFAGFDDLVDARQEEKPVTRLPEFVTRDQGRQLAYECFGPPRGRPALFLHGMLDGLSFGPMIQRLLVKHNIRLIGIWRPSFYRSDPDGDLTRAPERFCADIEAVMDAENISDAPILGHLGGSLYAYAAAAILGPRISGLVCVGGAVPITDPALIRRQPRRQRIIGLTAKYFPASLPLLLRAGIGDFDADGGKRFINDLYKNLPIDKAVLDATGNFERYRDELEKGLSQGYRGFQIDAASIVRDWDHWPKDMKQPVDLIHGAHDQIVQIEAVQAFAKRHPSFQLTEIADLGQLILYARPEIALTKLAAY